MKFGSLLIRNTVFRGLNIIAGILITFILLRLLSVKDFGLYSLMMANAAIFNLFTSLGSESGIVYNYSAGKLKPKSVLGILFSVTFFQLLLLIVAELIFYRSTGSYWIAGWETKDAFLFGLLFLFSLAVNDKYVSLLNAAHLYTLTNKVIFVSNLILLTVLSFFLVADNEEPGFFYLKIIVLGAALQAVLLVLSFHFISKQPFSFSFPDKREIKTFFSYSFIAFATNCIQFLAYRIDYWILDFYHGDNAVGIYSVAVRLGQLFWVFPMLFATIILPKMASGNDNEEKIISLMRITILLMACITVIAFALSPYVIPWVGGEAYRQSVMPFWYLLPGIFFFSITTMVAAYFAGVNKLRINLMSSVICLVSVVVLDFVLIPSMSAEGASLASGVGYSIATFYTIWAFAHYKQKSIFYLFVINKRDLLLINNYIKGVFNYK